MDSLHKVLKSFLTWQNSPLGQYVLMLERLHLSSITFKESENLVLEISNAKLLSPQHHPNVSICALPIKNQACDLLCAPSQLPFESRMFDLVICPHIFEMSQDPSPILHECVRILKPQQYLICFGICPVGIWKLQKFCSPSQLSWLKRTYSLYQLRKYLGEYGCALQTYKRFAACPILPNLNALKYQALDSLGHLLSPWLGNVYLTVWQKNVITLSPITRKKKQNEFSMEV
jgi:hypothetical protein